MTGAFPVKPSPSSMAIRSIQPTLVSISHSLKTSRRSRGGQRWGFKLSYQNRSRSEMMPLLAFAMANRGQFGTFSFTPVIIGSRRSGSGNPVVSTATATGRSVPVNGLTAMATVASAGDLVKFAGHPKVYMVTADVVTNDAGSAVLTIEPALYSPVGVAEAVIFDGVSLTVSFSADTHEMPLSFGGVMSWECELVEVL